jgi:type IV pilus assembly protein PilA
MSLQNLRARVGARLNGDSEAGFTLIELLVVMLILGILAAIALPAFFNQKEKAGDSKAKENAHTAQVAVETYATEHNGEYANVSTTALHAIEPVIPQTPGNATTKTEGIIVESPTGEPKKYILQSVSSTGTVFKIENNGGAMKYECTQPEHGGCPAGGDWSK